VDPGLRCISDKELTGIILENLIDNAIKFHNYSDRVNPFVRIEITSKGDQVLLSVVDNGIGVDEKNKNEIFKLFVRATDRSDTGGIGLYLSKLATLKLGGDITVSKSMEGYTVFKVLLPQDLSPVIEKRQADEMRREKRKQKLLKAT